MCWGNFPTKSLVAKARCACAGYCQWARLVLADEPTGHWTAPLRVLMETMQEMNASLQATILMVTHDPFSASYASRILVLKDGTIYGELERYSNQNAVLWPDLSHRGFGRVFQMYARLSVRNVHRSLRNYVLYFTTLTLIVALMYAFMS